MATRQITATATGASAVITFPAGLKWMLSLRSSGAYGADLQVGNDGDANSFKDFYTEEGTKVAFVNSGRQDFVVPGGRSYRLNVTTYNSEITITAFPT